ncbi:MAG: hypothetical protein IT232_08700 [Flavobacteriales bacterium]|nr:hypothetical protein [Flavobacteriales bacterium]
MVLLKFLNKKFLLINIISVLIIFATSILLRIPNVKPTQYLGKEHDWITAHVLLTNSIWQKNGILKYKLNPVFTFDYEHDRKISIFNHVIDEKGDKFYISYPPFAFYVPFAIFKLTGSFPNVAGIRSISLAVQFFTGFLLFLLVYHIGGKNIKNEFYFPAIVAFLLYTFNAANLWVNGNLYFADVLVQLFFVGFVYTVIQYLSKSKTQKTNNPKKYFYYSVILGFLMVYTEWIGVFVLFVSFVVSLIYIKNRAFLKLAFWSSAAGVFALLVTLFQYSQISGWNNLISTLNTKFEERSGISDNVLLNFTISNPVARDALKNYYIEGYNPLLWGLAIIFVLAILFSLIKPTFNTDKKSEILIAILLATIPVLLHILLLFNFNSWHRFSIHKTSFPLILSIALLLIIIFNRIENYKKLTIFFICIFSVGFSFIAFRSYSDYTKKINPSFNFTVNKIAAEAIQKYSKPTDIIYTNAFSCPELMFYAQRNTFTVNNIEECIAQITTTEEINEGLYVGCFEQVLDCVYRIEKSGNKKLLWQREINY